VNLYLIRHADAAPLGEGGITQDEDRPLTEKGFAQAEKLANGLQQRDVRLSLVVTSPLLRARQTAERLSERWSLPAPDLRTCQELAPGGKRRKLARFLESLMIDDLAIVGHQPDLSEFAAWLVGSKKAQIDLAKAGSAYLACVTPLRRGSGTLIWLVTPEWLG
jgi:phosphohistidine phosphatase